MRVDTLTKEQADLIVGWARTEAGEFFQAYLSEQAEPAWNDLVNAANMRDVFRAQGAQQMLERVMQFFAHAKRVSDGTVPAYQESEGTPEDVHPLPPPWGPPVDDGS